MTTQLADFLPSYPPYERNELPLFNIYDDEQTNYHPDMYQTLRRKKEFSELTLPASEEQPLPGQLLMHQMFIQRFLSGYTPYHSLLIWHEVGTGKTLTSLSVAENMKQFQSTRALILVKGRNVERNIRYEIRKHFPYYVPIFTDKKASLRQINERINASYEINTFRIFCKEIAFAFRNDVPEQQKKDHKERIKAQYSNRVIIIDEVHNLREEKGGQNVYDILHQFLHTVDNCKILLLSATPIKNSVEEFASIMNLILPLTKQFNVDKFQDYYFPNKKDLDATKKAEFITHIKGYVSYLRQSKNQAKVIEVGTIIPSIKGFPIVPLIMKPEQTMQYNIAIDNDGGLPDTKTVYDFIDQESELKRREVIEEEEESSEQRREVIEEHSSGGGTGIYQESRQAILSCFPVDPSSNRSFTYGSGGVKQGIERNDHYEPHMFDKIALSMVGRGTIQNKLDSLERYSNKFHYVVKSLLDQPSRKMFVYSEFIGGSGLFLLEQVLVQFQFQHCDKRPQITKNENPYEHILQSEPRSRYAIITSKLSDVDIYFLLHIFNHPLNKYGQYIRVLMGSKTIGESHSLTCIRDIMILTPHWNYTETEQAIGRGVRAFSHRDLPQDQQTVTIHRLASVLPEEKRTIDRYMYEVSYHKDMMIKQIEYASRESAIDCTFHKNRNRYDNDLYRNKRECFYTDCDYMCYEEKEDPVTLSDTYNLFYTEKEYRQVKQIMQYQFQTVSRFSYSIDEIIQLIHDQQVTFPKHVTLRCLNELIQRQEPFMNPLGFTSYLKEHQNEFFLSYHVLTSKEEDVFYTQQGELYPYINPFMYLDQLELDSIELIMTTLRQSNIDTSIRILSQLPNELRLLILRGVIQLYHNEPVRRSSRPYLQQLIDIGIRQDWLLSTNTLETMPPERYMEMDGVYQWIIDTNTWSQDTIGDLIDILQSNAFITVYGYKKEGKLYLYDLAQKKFLSELKRFGRDCDNIPIEINRTGSSLHDYYKRLTGETNVSNIPKERIDICHAIKHQLESFTLDDKPFSLIFPSSVHETMRDYLKQKQEEQKAKPKVPTQPKPPKDKDSQRKKKSD